MAAPDYETIFDVEDQVESACKRVLERDYLFKAFTQFETRDLPDERVDIQLKLGASQGHKGFYAPGRAVRDAWNATLTFAVWTERKEGKRTLHGRRRARIRMACEYFLDKFKESELPYHALSSITHRASDPSVSVEDDLDVSVLTYDLIVSVRTDAWPPPTSGLMTEDGQMLISEDGEILAADL